MAAKAANWVVKRFSFLRRHRCHHMTDKKKLSVFYIPFPLCLQILPAVVEIARVLPLVTFPLVYFLKGEKSDDEMWVAIGVLLFFMMLGVLIFISILRTGNENPGTMEIITRYDVAFVSTPKRVEVSK